MFTLVTAVLNLRSVWGEKNKEKGSATLCHLSGGFVVNSAIARSCILTCVVKKFPSCTQSQQVNGVTAILSFFNIWLVVQFLKSSCTEECEIRLASFKREVTRQRK